MWLTEGPTPYLVTLSLIALVTWVIMALREPPLLPTRENPPASEPRGRPLTGGFITFGDSVDQIQVRPIIAAPRADALVEDAPITMAQIREDYARSWQRDFDAALEEASQRSNGS